MPSIDIIEEDEDGGFDISGDSPASPLPPPPETYAKADVEVPQGAAQKAETGATFIASTTFAGRKSGFVYKTGEKGLGYYADGSATREPEAAVTPAPSDFRLELVHKQGSATPAIVELAVELGSKGSAAKAADVKVEITEAHVAILSAKQWEGTLEVPLKYAVSPAQSQGWLDKGTLTLRFPIAA